MIAIVIPTVREKQYKSFVKAWSKLIEKHNATLITVWDGDTPRVTVDGKKVEVEIPDLIYNKNDGVRNLGFLEAVKRGAEIIITLDDDVEPLGDPIQDHLDALNQEVPVSWMSTASEYMRGFPYEVRDEAEVVLSHGVWEGVKDYDAPTQLVNGNKDVTFYKGSIPKGIYFPMCIMNVAFKSKLLPYMYQAPMGHKVGMDRFADIWSGIEVKREIDKKGWAAVTGYSTVYHKRASNVYKNLQKEAKGIELNETFWKKDPDDPYFKLYRKEQKKWKKLCTSLL